MSSFARSKMPWTWGSQELLGCGLRALHSCPSPPLEVGPAASTQPTLNSCVLDRLSFLRFQLGPSNVFSQSLAPSRLNTSKLSSSSSLRLVTPPPPLQTPPFRPAPPREAPPYLGISTRPSQAGPAPPGHASPIPDLAHCPLPGRSGRTQA